MRKRGSMIQLELPDPFKAGAAFLAWLAKQGQDQELSVCEYQWELANKNFPTTELKGIKLTKYIKNIGMNV